MHRLSSCNTYMQIETAPHFVATYYEYGIHKMIELIRFCRLFYKECTHLILSKAIHISHFFIQNISKNIVCCIETLPRINL